MKLILFIASFFMLNFCFSQDCKVKLKKISEHYQGECKRGIADGQGKASGIDSYTGNFQKGLPDGQGIYIWANGDRYEGEFKKGRMEGKGKLSVQLDGKVTEGFWKKGEFVGQHETPYRKIDKSSDVSSYSISQSSDKSNTIRLYFKENQNTIRNPNINPVVHNGNYINLINARDYIELTEVSYPFKARVLMNQQYIEFEIFNAGSWTVNVNITSINGLNRN